MLYFINRMPSWQKIFSVMLHDLFFAGLSFYLSLAIRFESFDLLGGIGNITYIKSLMIVMASQFVSFYMFGLYKGIWRYSSTNDLLRIIKGSTAAIIISYILLFLFFRLSGIPRSSIVINWFLLIITLGGGRLSYRLIRDKDIQRKNKRSFECKRILIVGAGASGEHLFREIRKNMSLPFEVVGFIDDDPAKVNKLLHGVKILGNSEKLPQLTEDLPIDKIFIAMPSATGEQIKRVVDICAGLDVEVKILPKMSDIINGNARVSQLRDVKIEDILGRKEIFLNQDSIKSIIQDKKVMITGAGGSIGSELVVQIIKFSPRQLILLDISEINLFNLERRVKEIVPDNNFEFIIADVRNRPNIEAIFSKFNPDIVLHAAAYKHVPLMEKNPLQAIHTNVFGTYNMADLSIKYHVKNFVFVSTDKAVNPTNVMGVSKRIAEIVCQAGQRKSSSIHFTTVRFGNVLGSSGSVIPIFKEQILKGGPVTVTHPEIQRYFMSIPEASQLILQAATLGNGGEIFVLDMGEAVKIIDIAKQLIKLANRNGDREIEIEITGLRPGEKLYEELLADKETTLPTCHPLVRTAKSVMPSQDIVDKIQFLMSLENAPVQKIKAALLEIVPEYDLEQRQNKIFSSESKHIH